MGLKTLKQSDTTPRKQSVRTPPRHLQTHRKLLANADVAKYSNATVAMNQATPHYLLRHFVPWDSEVLMVALRQWMSDCSTERED